MMPFLNSVEIQAHALAIAAMTIRENAIDPRSSPTLFLPLHVFYLVGDPAMPALHSALLFAFFLAFHTSKLSHPHFQPPRVNRKIIGPGPAICILNKVIAMPD